MGQSLILYPVLPLATTGPLLSFSPSLPGPVLQVQTDYSFLTSDSISRAPHIQVGTF